MDPEVTAERRAKEDGSAGRPLKGSVLLIGALLVGSWTIVTLAGSVVAEVTSLFPEVAPAHPYFLPQHGWLLYVRLPAVALSAVALLLLPGVCLVLATGRASGWADVAVLGFGTSYLLNVALTTILKPVLGTPIDGADFRTGLAIVAATCWVALLWRVRAGVRWPLTSSADTRRILWTVAIVLVTLLSLIPVMFWQDMNDDGFEALEIGRSLSRFYLPRWPFEPRVLGLGVGLIGMAYPVQWFVLLFGPLEASARLPLLLYLPALFWLVVQTAEQGSPRRMRFSEEAALFVAFATFTVTMAFNASYDPYFADVAAPAAFEVLTVLCMLAAFEALRAGRDGWFLWYAILGFLCRPTGLLVLGLYAVGCLLAAPGEARRWLPRIGVAIVICLGLAVAHEALYVPWVLGDATVGYASSSVFGRMRFIQFFDFRRLAFAAFPCGLLPFFSLFAWKRQDPFARVLTIVALAYFAFFYFQAFIALHHFVPMMILSLAIFWRNHLQRGGLLGSWTLPVVFAAGAVSFWLSLPTHFEINRNVRPIGYRTAYLVGNYESDYDEVVRHAELLSKLIPWDWDAKDPGVELVSSPNTIIYYATRPKPSDVRIDYVMQPLSDVPPPSFLQIASDEQAALYVRDEDTWRRDRYRELRVDFRSSLYYIPRETLYPHWGRPAGNYSLDLKALVFYLKALAERSVGTSPD